MQHKTNDLARFLEIKHRYWHLLKDSQLPKQLVQHLHCLFRHDNKHFLFRGFD